MKGSGEGVGERRVLTLLPLSHSSQARLRLLGSGRSHGCYHCPDFHSRPQVLISCIIHLLALAAVISSLHSPYGALTRPSMFQQSRANTRL